MNKKIASLRIQLVIVAIVCITFFFYSLVMLPVGPGGNDLYKIFTGYFTGFIISGVVYALLYRKLNRTLRQEPV